MAPHSSTLAWKIPWTEEPGGLQSTGSRRVGHDWATSLSLFTFMHLRRKWQPTPVFLPGESQRQWSLVGCHLWGCRIGHDWSDLAAAAAAGWLGAIGWTGCCNLGEWATWGLHMGRSRSSLYPAPHCQCWSLLQQSRNMKLLLWDKPEKMEAHSPPTLNLRISEKLVMPLGHSEKAL